MRTPAATGNLSGFAYKHIADKLLSGQLVPGQKLSEPAFARELNISRTPVREAIQHLRNEGLLKQVPSSGTYVAESNRVPLVETYEIRLALETMAVRTVAKRAKAKDLSGLKKCCDRMKSVISAVRKISGLVEAEKVNRDP